MTKLVFKVRRRGPYTHYKFPLKLRPQEDELLSSWLIRLALRHRTMPMTFTNLYMPETRNKLWSADMDLQSDPDFLSALATKSGAPLEALQAMTLGAYEGYLFEKAFTKTGGTQFVMPLRMRGRQSTSFGLRFCPKCLREDEQPYFRRKWRLSFSTACLRHKCFLQDRCPACQVPLTIYRKPSVSDFPNCDKCGFRLKDAEVESIAKDSYGLKAIKRMYAILGHGFVMLGEVPVYSFLFFVIIHQLWKAVHFWDKTGGFLRHEVMRDRLDDLTWELKPTVLEQIRLKEQYLFFSGLMHLFEDYPHRLVDYCHRNQFGKTELAKDLRIVPYWYSKIVDRFDQTFRPLSSEEVSSALRYVTSQGMSAGRVQVVELIGRGIDFRKRKDIAKVFSLYRN